MIKVSVLYPKTATSRFDMTYYLERHIPMVKAKLGDAVRAATIDHGLAGGAPGQPPTYAVMSHLCFDSVDAFHAAFGPHADAILADVQNYSSEPPVLQISDVLG